MTLAYDEDDPELDGAAVDRTAGVLEAAEACVMEAITSGAGHAITDDAIDAVDAILDEILGDGRIE